MGLKKRVTWPGLNIQNTSKPSLRTMRSEERREIINISSGPFSFEEIKMDTREEILNCQKH